MSEKHRLTSYTKAEEIFVSALDALNFEDKIKNQTDQNLAQIFKQKQKAATIFKYDGLPSRKHEDWRYSDLRKLLKTVPDFSATLLQNLPNLKPLAAETIVIKSDGDGAKNVDSLRQFSVKSLGQDPNFLLEFLPKDFQNLDSITQLNSAFIEEGTHLSILENIVLDKPIELQIFAPYQQTHNGTFVQGRKNSQGRLIQRFFALQKETLQTHVTRIILEENAELSLVVFLDRDAPEIQLLKWQAILHEGAKLNLYIIQACSFIGRKEIKVDLIGEGADFQLRVVNLLEDCCEANIFMDVCHQAAHTMSREILRNIVKDSAKGSFQGLIRVARDAQKVDAKMSCKSLILSQGASFFAKPELEIFADDVACGHGATVAQLDENALFYLMARGICKEQAQKLLIKAFATDVLMDIKDEMLQQVCLTKIEEWLAL